MTANPHMEAKINALVEQGVTYSELVYMLMSKDVERVEMEARLEARIAELEAALGVFADPRSWYQRQLDDFLLWNKESDPVVIAQAVLGGNEHE